ncbi:Translocon-associated protein subunit alpha [Lamellibrachia satsuma]|nr:Translocon-associated protein subunit alpha [Lamellibrachia satsuma]
MLILLLVLPSVIMLAGNGGGSSGLAHAEDQSEDAVEDLADGEDDAEATVESDEVPVEGTTEESTVAETDNEKEEEDDESEALKASSDANTYLLFTEPADMSFKAGRMVKLLMGFSSFKAGRMVKLLMGFSNNGEKDFIVESMEASFRYPQDYSFFIQNFTGARYNRLVEPNRQATFEYGFTPSDTFSSRPFGLTINVNYKDTEGKPFQDAVFNETINIVEPDDGFDGETFFLYVFLAAVVVLLVIGAQQLLASFGKKHLPKKSKPIVELGTQNKNDVDYDWLPKHTINNMNKSPRRSPRQSPRQRRTNRGMGSGEE